MGLLARIFGNQKRASSSVIDEIDSFMAIRIGSSAGFDYKSIFGAVGPHTTDQLRARCAIFYLWCARRAVISISQHHAQPNVLHLLGDHIARGLAVNLGRHSNVSQHEIFEAFDALDRAVANDDAPGWPYHLSCAAMQFMAPATEQSGALFNSPNMALALAAPARQFNAAYEATIHRLKPLLLQRSKLLNVSEVPHPAPGQLLHRWNVLTNTDTSNDQFNLFYTPAGKYIVTMQGQDLSLAEGEKLFKDGQCSGVDDAYDRAITFLSNLLNVSGMMRLPCTRKIIFDTAGRRLKLQGELRFRDGTVMEMRQPFG